MHIFKALVAFIVPEPGYLNCSDANVDVLFIHALVEPMRKTQPWARALATVVKSTPYWKDLLNDFRTT
eukprot:7602905-Pyramimonas_sp.AAC.1